MADNYGELSASNRSKSKRLLDDEGSFSSGRYGRRVIARRSRTSWNERDKVAKREETREREREGEGAQSKSRIETRTSSSVSTHACLGLARSA